MVSHLQSGFESLRYRHILMVITLIFLGVLGSTSARAGTVVAIGDNNITDNLPSDSATAQFFTNLLGGGKTVGLLDYDIPDYDLSIDNTNEELETHYSGIGAMTRRITGRVAKTDLAGLDLFVAAMPDDIFESDEVSVLSHFLWQGGTAVFLGDNNFRLFRPANEAIRKVLKDLDTGLAYAPLSAGFNRATAAPGGRFTKGVDSVEIVSGSAITGGEAQFLLNRLPVIAAADVPAPSPVPLPASLPFLAATVGAAIWFGRRKAR